jgi:hypothetical protein
MKITFSIDDVVEILEKRLENYVPLDKKGKFVCSQKPSRYSTSTDFGFEFEEDNTTQAAEKVSGGIGDRSTILQTPENQKDEDAPF